MRKTNKLLKIQDMLYNQMKRLDDDKLMKEGLGKREIMRSGALSQSVCSYIKAVQTNIKISNMCKENKVSKNAMLEELGVLSED